MKTISHINFEGRRFNQAGHSTFDNRLLYIDNANGDEIELYPAVVTDCEPDFALVSVARSPALSHVQVDHQALQGASYGLRVGDEVLIGNIQFRVGRKPRAQAAWMVTPVGANGTNGHGARVTPATPRMNGNNGHGGHGGHATPHAPRTSASGAGRLRGRIVNVAAAGDYGFISTDSGLNLFVHLSELQGVPLLRGQEVTYELGENTRGPIAKRVRAA